MNADLLVGEELKKTGTGNLNSVASRPFRGPDNGKIAVEVISDYGDEVMKILEVD